MHALPWRDESGKHSIPYRSPSLSCDADLLAELTAYNIEARYGDYKESLSEVVDIQKAKILYDQTQELFQWLYTKLT